MKKKFLAQLMALSMLASLFAGCGTNGASQASDQTDSAEVAQEVEVADIPAWKSLPQNIIDDKYRTFYEIFLYSYCDSNGDGIGDINGLISKLDYLNDGDAATTDDLGITGIWLMPVMASPTYHKYDTTDYMTIDPDYGTNEEFKTLLDECHKRGINVIIDLAMNHSSSEHPWFKEAKDYIQHLEEGKEPDSSECKYVDYYNFSREAKSGYAKVPGVDWYYEAQFWEGMPDLNLLNEEVQKEYEDIAKYWLDLGVDGFRLDAVKYFELGDTDACINTLSWFNDYVKSVKENAYIVCECWDNQQVYAQYYASGVDSMFDFAFADAEGLVAKTVNGKKKGSDFAQALEDEEAMYSAINPNYINAPFYTNHDMSRGAGFFAGELAQARVKMAEGVNLLTSGNVFIYYGDELGMKGSGDDENKRAPMQWSSDKAAEGMCKGPGSSGTIEMKYGSLEDQQSDPDSIYSYVKDAILIRNQNPEILRGSTKNLTAISSDRIAAVSKTYNASTVYVIYNTAEESQTVDLSSIGEELELVGALCANGGEAVLEGSSLTLPELGIVVLK